MTTRLPKGKSSSQRAEATSIRIAVLIKYERVGKAPPASSLPLRCFGLLHSTIVAACTFISFFGLGSRRTGATGGVRAGASLFSRRRFGGNSRGDRFLAIAAHTSRT